MENKKKNKKFILVRSGIVGLAATVAVGLGVYSCSRKEKAPAPVPEVQTDVDDDLDVNEPEIIEDFVIEDEEKPEEPIVEIQEEEKEEEKEEVKEDATKKTTAPKVETPATTPTVDIPVNVEASESTNKKDKEDKNEKHEEKHTHRYVVISSNYAQVNTDEHIATIIERCSCGDTKTTTKTETCSYTYSDNGGNEKGVCLCEREATRAHTLTEKVENTSNGDGLTHTKTTYETCDTCDHKIVKSQDTNVTCSTSSYTNNGSAGEIGHCDTCGQTITRGHTLTDSYGSTWVHISGTDSHQRSHSKVCSTCGYTQELDPDVASCDKSGSWSRRDDLTEYVECPDCHEEYVAHTHTMTSTEINHGSVGCPDDLCYVTKYVCNDCGSYEYTVNGPGHTWVDDDWYDEVMGIMNQKCSCGATRQYEVVSGASMFSMFMEPAMMMASFPVEELPEGEFEADENQERIEQIESEIEALEELREEVIEESYEEEREEEHEEQHEEEAAEEYVMS